MVRTGDCDFPVGFPGGSAGKEPTCNAGNLDSIPGLGRSPREGKGYPLLYSGLENSMDCIVHRVTKESDRTEQLSLSLQGCIKIRAPGFRFSALSQWPVVRTGYCDFPVVVNIT